MSEGRREKSEQFEKLNNSTVVEMQPSNTSASAKLFWFPEEFRKEGRREEYRREICGFRSRIRVERPSDIAVWGIVSTRVLDESAQNFAAIQRNPSGRPSGRV